MRVSRRRDNPMRITSLGVLRTLIVRAAAADLRSLALATIGCQRRATKVSPSTPNPTGRSAYGSAMGVPSGVAFSSYHLAAFQNASRMVSSNASPRSLSR
jgi:hypothetical protein